MASLAKNTTYYTFALTFQKVLAFLYFTFMARILGPEDIGKYVTALSFTTLFTVFVDVGLSPLLIREVAKKEDAHQLLTKVLSIKVPLAFLSYGAIVIAAQLMGYSPVIKALIYVAGVVMLLDSFSLTFWAVVRGFQNLRWESINVIIFQIILVSLGGIFLIKGYGVLPLVYALLAASLFQFFFSIHAVNKYCRNYLRNWRFQWDPHTFKSLIKISLPFALAGIFIRIYTSFDTVMISKMIGDQAVGWYSIPIKIVLAFQFLPLAFVASLYPAMSAAYQNAKINNETPDRLIGLFEQSMRYLMIMGFPIGFGISVLAERLITDIWTDSFLPTVWPMRILMAGLIILFLSFPLGSLLNATDRQKINTKNIGIMLISNIVLNFMLIPIYGITGAAIASFIASSILFILNLIQSHKIISFNPKPLIIYASKIFAASSIMSVIAWYMDSITLFIVAPVSAAVYIALLFLTRALTKEGIEKLSAVFQK